MRGLPFSEGKGGVVVGDGERRDSGEGQHALSPGTRASIGPELQLDPCLGSWTYHRPDMGERPRLLSPLSMVMQISSICANTSGHVVV